MHSAYSQSDIYSSWITHIADTEYVQLRINAALSSLLLSRSIMRLALIYIYVYAAAMALSVRHTQLPIINLHF